MSISFPPSADRELRARGAGVTAVLGPTNTGKTHLAIERMLAHSSGIIGLPLRLLAREVYNRAVERVGAGGRRVVDDDAEPGWDGVGRSVAGGGEREDGEERRGVR